MARSTRPEVLSPAGNPESLQAAVRAGADAVYFGVEDYNARIRARNFTLDDLPETIAELHRDGIRAYVTFNTLLFSHEEQSAHEALERIIAAGPDALIVQDIGVARWLRDRHPAVTIHASTQTTTSSVEGIEFLHRFGVKRVILARELTLPEVRSIREATDVELEVFVHGALCVSYSGQCLSSEAWGGRSANRGQCAQACRLPYELLVDGVLRDLGDAVHLLSPRDLEGVARVPALIEAGIHGLKIEGRMKSPEYVAAATRLYREAVDRTWEGRLPDEVGSLLDQTRRVFSRGGSEGFLGGIDHQKLVDGRTRSHRGVPVGHVARTRQEEVEIDLGVGAPRLSPGDGLLFAPDALEEHETGAKVFTITPDGTANRTTERIRVGFGHGHGPDPQRLRPGCPVYLTHDHRLQSELKRLIRDPNRRRKIPITITVRGSVGRPLRTVFGDEEGNRVSVASGVPLKSADRHPLDLPVLLSHLARLGATRYEIAEIENHLDGDLALPVGELNRMRREAIAWIEAIRENPPVDTTGGIEPPAGPVHREEIPSPVATALARAGDEIDSAETPRGRADSESTDDPFLLVCRSEEQVRVALQSGARRIVLDFLDLVGLKQAALTVRREGAELTLALPRIQKPGEERIWDFFLRREPDAILVRNLASLHRLARETTRPRLIGDVSLNAVNRSAITLLLEAGCDRVAPGLDLNSEQLPALLQDLPIERIEIPLHHHLPVFHTEHCVFAAVLSDGADWRTCGRPCDRHRLHLRDRAGQEHSVVADVGCRNTVFGARAQSVLAQLPRMRALGVRHYRLELLEQDAAATATLLSTYREVWNGTCSEAEGMRRLQAEARFGIFAGSPEPPRHPDWKPPGGRRPRTGARR